MLYLTEEQNNNWAGFIPKTKSRISQEDKKLERGIVKILHLTSLLLNSNTYSVKVIVMITLSGQYLVHFDSQ